MLKTMEQRDPKNAATVEKSSAQDGAKISKLLAGQ